MSDIGTTEMMRIAQIAEQLKLSYKDMQITSKEIENLMEKHRSQHRRFMECCTKLKELLNNEDSV